MCLIYCKNHLTSFLSGSTCRAFRRRSISTLLRTRPPVRVGFVIVADPVLTVPGNQKSQITTVENDRVIQLYVLRLLLHATTKNFVVIYLHFVWKTKQTNQNQQSRSGVQTGKIQGANNTIIHITVIFTATNTIIRVFSVLSTILFLFCFCLVFTNFHRFSPIFTILFSCSCSCSYIIVAVLSIFF